MNRKINKSIEIVSSPHLSLSSMGQLSREAIHTQLSKRYRNVKITLVSKRQDLVDLADRKPDLVFLGMKHLLLPITKQNPTKEKLWVSEFLDEHGIAYTGSTHLSHKLDLDKPSAKAQIQTAGLATASYHVISQKHQDSFDYSSLTYPVFIKPTNRGGGLGVDQYSVARNPAQALSKVKSLRSKNNADALVETFLNGREFSVAILRKPTGQYTMMPLELVADEDAGGERMLSSKVKESDSEHVSLVTEPALRAQLSELAHDCFVSLGGRDYGRIDLRMDSQGTPYFLEANLIPSLIDNYGSFPKACALDQRLTHEQMLKEIVDLAFARNDVDATGEYAQFFTYPDPIFVRA